MLKYYNTQVVFQEIPDEITLAINITNCPFNCDECHSPYLREDIGTELTYEEVRKLLNEHVGVSCVLFLGGDRQYKAVENLANDIKFGVDTDYLKVAWYSGQDKIPDDLRLDWFDYIKVGHYDKEKGPLNNPNTNQRLYYVDETMKLHDITNKFWKNESSSN